MKIPYNILIQIKMSVRPYFKGFTLIFFFYNCRKQEYNRNGCFGPHTGKNDGSLALPVHHASQCLQSCMECASGNGRPSTLRDCEDPYADRKRPHPAIPT